MGVLQRFWDALSDADTREKLKFLGGAAVVAIGGVWSAYVYFSAQPAAPPAQPTATMPVAAPPIDAEAAKRLSDSQKATIDAETCALNNVTRQISGQPPLPCPPPR